MNKVVYIDCVRGVLAGFGLLSLTCIGGALYLQYFHQQLPCPLCIVQRYAYVLIIVGASIGALTRRLRVIAMVAVGIAVAAAAGLVTAARQLWLLKHPVLSCGFDALQPMVDRLPLAYLLPSVFKVSGLCDTAYPPVWGFPLPAWSLLALSVIFILSVFILWRSAAILSKDLSKN